MAKRKRSFEIDQASIRAVNKALSDAPDKMRRKVAGKGLRKAGKIVGREVKILVPQGQTKQLKRAAGKVRSRKKSRTKYGIVVKVESPVAANLEYGTEHIEERGFMKKAVANTHDQAINELIESIAELVKELSS